MSDVLQDFSYADLDAGEKSRIRAADVSSLVTFRETHHTFARVFPFRLHDEDVQQLRTIYKRYKIMMCHDNIRRSSHPIPSCMLWAATMDFYDEASSHPNFIDFGGSISSVLKNGKAHGCLLSDTARDVNRYLTSVNSKLQSSRYSRPDEATLLEDFRNKIFSVRVADADRTQQLFDRFCFGGAQCCN
jgi:hypothetical protein